MYYIKKGREEDLGKITDEIMELLPQLRETFFIKLKNCKIINVHFENYNLLFSFSLMDINFIYLFN